MVQEKLIDENLIIQINVMLNKVEDYYNTPQISDQRIS